MPSILNSLLVAPPAVSKDEVVTIADKFFNIRGETKALGGERDRNYLVNAESGQFLLKIANKSEDDSILSMQCNALEHIARCAPDLRVPRLHKTHQQESWAIFETHNGETLRARLFDYLPGQSIGQNAENPEMLFNLGGAIAKLNTALRGFNHPASQHALAWNIQCVDLLADLLPHLKTSEESDLVSHVLEIFLERVKPQLPYCKHQVIHNDVSFHNALVQLDNPAEIAGIFDFGDMVYGPLVQDLANPAAEIPAGSAEPLHHSAALISGYHAISPLEKLEIALLPDMISARLALCLLLEAWADSTTDWQDDREHIDGWHHKCVDMLRKIKHSPKGSFERQIRSSCAIHETNTDPKRTSNGHADKETAWNKRLQFIGNAHYYAYEKPLHLVRGDGVWLYDTNGDRYLDAYNNVPHAGHCHPALNFAIAEQTSKLNTNTRYLYDVAADYAEKICSTLPTGLDTCYFVSSGSEANDLAWRLATHWSGNSGALVLENAYHGITDATYALSPAEYKSCTKSFSHVGQFAAPDDYRGPWKRSDPDRGAHYAEYVSDAIQQLKTKGHQPAALYLDMIMSSDGVFTPPPGYLESVFPQVHRSGGLCIADEVQSGFGRTGKHMWGFEFGTATPDIVTLGKPIAGGYPMGLVITRKEIAETFSHQTDFFSTTGGNPVACAAALTMLQIVEQENLMQNADKVGKALADGLRSLSKKFSIIGDVRGSGLFIGVEIICGDDDITPSASLTKNIVNGLRNRRILVGSDGKHHNVLKIRPPMVFDNANTDFFLQMFDNVLTDLTLP